MNVLELLQQIFEVCILPLLGLLTAFAIKWIQLKENEIVVSTDNMLTQKYIKLLADTITECVIATNQTYVSSLKNQNAFDKNAQKVAFDKTYQAVMSVLTDEAKKYLAATYDDLNTYIITKIEAEVNNSKINLGG